MVRKFELHLKRCESKLDKGFVNCERYACEKSGSSANLQTNLVETFSPKAMPKAAFYRISMMKSFAFTSELLKNVQVHKTQSLKNINNGDADEFKMATFAM